MLIRDVNMTDAVRNAPTSLNAKVVVEVSSMISLDSVAANNKKEQVQI